MNKKDVYRQGDWAREMREKERSLMSKEGMENEYIYIEEWSRTWTINMETVVCLDGRFSSKQLRALADLVDEASELYKNINQKKEG